MHEWHTKIIRSHNGVVVAGVLLSLGLLFFDPALVAVEVVLGVALWFLLGSAKEGKDRPLERRWYFLSFGVLLLGLLLSRLYPFFFSQAPLGYDTGVYRYEFLQSFQALPEYVSHIFLGLPLISDVLQLFGWPVDQLMRELYIAVSVLLPLTVVFFAGSRWGNRSALLVLFFFLVSLVQWKAYDMVLFKQLPAISLVFFSFWLIERRSFLVLIPLAFLALLQPLDLLFVGLAIALTALAKKTDRKYLLVLISIALIAGGGLLLFDLNSWIYSLQVLWKGVSDPLQLDSSLQSGLFLSLADYGYQAAFFFVFGLLGWLYDLKKRGWNVVSFYFLILFGWIAIRFFFYQRVLIQFDVVLLMYSAVFLGALWRVQIGRLFKGLVAVGVTLGMIVPFVVSLADFSPMISEREWQGIRQFCGQLEPKTYVMATHSLYGTWLRGYCPDQLVIAPGMFEHDRWSLLDWRDFWRGDEGRLLELLRRYDTQLYLYVGEKQPQLRLSQDLFEELGSGWAKLKFR